MPVPMSESDAMVVAALATEVFNELVQLNDAYGPPPDILRGAMLFFAEVLTRTQPFLPQRESLRHVQTAIVTAQRTAAAIRINLGMPAIQ